VAPAAGFIGATGIDGIDGIEGTRWLRRRFPVLPTEGLPMPAETRSIARTAIYSLYPILLAFPTVGFAAALLTDIAYWRSAEMMWSNFSAWLISAGVIIGYLAAIAGLIDLGAERRFRARPFVWWYALAGVIVLALATVNMFVHTHDAWTSVVPWGLALSAATVLALLISAWLGWSMIVRPSVNGARL
jgi:uncharacterized membrane protein